MSLLVPVTFRSSRKAFAATVRELRKVGASALLNKGLIGSGGTGKDKVELRQQNTGGASNREPQIGLPAAFSADRHYRTQGARFPPDPNDEQRLERLPVLFRYSKAAAVMQKVHRLTDN
jgi:hypothetical protein